MSAPTRELTFEVEGLDCADCAVKIERAVRQLPGAVEVVVAYGSGKLFVKLGAGTAPEAVAQAVEPLGYRVRPEDEPPGEAPWWRNPKVKMLGVSAGFLVLALASQLVWPAAARWVWSAGALVSVAPLARKAWAVLRAGNGLDINALVAIAVVGAILIDAAPEALVVVFLFLVGEVLEGHAAARARGTLRELAKLAPTKARRLEADGSVREVPVELLAVGERVQVPAGERIPADAVVEEGAGAVDESMLTGESAPVPKRAGDPIYAGTVLLEGQLVARVTAPGEDSALAQIQKLVERAGAMKSPTTRVIDRFARYYTPLVVVAAMLAATVPPLLFAQPWEVWIYRGLALLLIGCPCALVLSAPAAVTSALARAGRMGVLVKGGDVLETAGRLRALAFDKTGTLTEGRPRLVRVWGADEREVLPLVAALERSSAHPIAEAVLARARELGLEVPEAKDLDALPGAWVKGRVAGREVWVGSPAAAGGLPEGIRENSETASVVKLDGRTVAVLFFEDALRPEAAEALERIRALGIETVVLSGDREPAVRRLAERLGGVAYRAELRPEDKLRLVQELPHPVGMVGDGVNDAPTLAAADLGVAMGSGTQVALEAAGAALVEPNLTRLAHFLQLARATLSNIYANVAVALGLKAVFLVTTLLGYTGLWLAVMADTGATLLVTANALRLLAWQPSGTR
ncbi:cation-translocating P-type ATPase [Oceanithermus sp.]|uniref:heavy metal translocating P-type ATPase n=1 Tax=Oceanithermus sp. TaxID=2268145 RepID=UPI0025D334C6|nr:cation-translocating P-type ATPase [Oceanithermus sp.]